MSDVGIFTPYSTVKPLFTVLDDISWIPESEQDRIQSYQIYDEIYWNHPEVFKVIMMGTNDTPVYLPSGKTVVNETAHYLLKGLNISPLDDKNKDLTDALDSFLKREKFYSMFAVAKMSGVTRGDWVLHMTADPEQPEGRRISVNSIDPSSYFPVYDDDDVEKLIAVRLVDQILMDDGSTQIKMLQYSYEYFGSPIQRRVIREELVLKVDGWWKGKAERVVIKKLLKPEPLPDVITRIPVYHFKNGAWQGDPFGSSELRGHEYLISGVNQTASDEQLALNLEGLGVYATDAPIPTGAEGDEEDWVIAPGEVLHIPQGSEFKRVTGIKSIEPFLGHIEMLQKNLFEGSSTFRSSAIDVQLAESGIALAIKFMPTAAKLEQRDTDGLDMLSHFWFEWCIWHDLYEGSSFSGIELAITLGSKLPVNRIEVFNELNQMIDRKIITRDYYRQQIAIRLGYEFPDNMNQLVLDEEEKFMALAVPLNPAAQDNLDQNNANNGDKPNESAGTEAGKK